ncbi:MAG: hypothetical protein U1B30_16745 [Pseudomonadota bacterium]|nr:hypothetical protein [Pseudomonadota bacterium]
MGEVARGRALMKINALKLLLIFIMIMLCSELVSGSFTRSLNSSIRAADRISIVQIMSGEMIDKGLDHPKCRYRYGVSDLKTFRGQPVSEIMANTKLSIGSKYLLISKNKLDISGLDGPPSTIGPFENGCDLDSQNIHVVTYDEIFEISDHYAPSDDFNGLKVKQWVKFPAGAYFFDDISVVHAESRFKTVSVIPYVPVDLIHDYVMVSDIELVVIGLSTENDK